MRSVTFIAACCLAVAASPACVDPLNGIGAPSLVTETENAIKPHTVEDDRIEDKNPQFDATRTVEETFDGCTVTLNKSGTVTKLDIVPFDSGDTTGEILYATRAEAIAALQGNGQDVIPSMEVVGGAAKHVNDGVYAAIELMLQDGTEDVVGKRVFLADLIDAVGAAAEGASEPAKQHLNNGVAFLGAALSLGGGDLSNLEPGHRSAATAKAQAFAAKPRWARAVGFYTWSEALTQVFRQDRFLQLQDDPTLATEFGALAAIAAVLEQDPALTEAYERLLQTYAGLTNPYVSWPLTALFPHLDGVASLGDVNTVRSAFDAASPARFPCSDGVPRLAVLPASGSKDTAYYNEKFCYQSVPEGLTFIDVLIHGIKEGEVALAPDANSGWYDYQVHALETLLLPELAAESDHLMLTAAYKKKLIDSFKSMITQTRETHVKQLQQGATLTSAPAPEVDVYPQFAVEPFATYYLRTARGYRFVKAWLTGVLGDAMMSGKRVTPDSKGAQDGPTLAQSLDAMIDRHYGLFLISADSVGLDPMAQLLPNESAELDLPAARQAASDWLATWADDPDVARDSRVIVPVAADAETQESIYWAVIGVKAIRFNAAFVEDHEPEFVMGDFCDLDAFVDHDYTLLVEEMVEVRMPISTPPPTRDELRALANDAGDKDSIVSALEQL